MSKADPDAGSFPPPPTGCSRWRFAPSDTTRIAKPLCAALAGAFALLTAAESAISRHSSVNPSEDVHV